MNKPIAVISLLGITLAAFVAGRYTRPSNSSKAVNGRRILYYVDPMHPSYRSDKPGIAPDCGMALEPVYEGETPAAKGVAAPGTVTIPAEKQQLIGVRVEAVEKNTGDRLLRTTGRVEADENRVYKLSAATDGWVQSLQNNPAGTLVRKDELLATFYSREFRNAEQAYLGSLASMERLRGTNRDADDPNRLSDANLRTNEEQLRALGMGDPQIKELAKSHQITRDIAIVSPVDGIVLARNISPLQRFDARTEFYRIADLSKVWIVADVFGNDMPTLRPGTRVRIFVRELSKTMSATVSNAAPLFDNDTRTLKVRLEADNPGLVLRPDMYVDVELKTPAPVGISVPTTAVLDSGMRKIVYVETSDGVFEPRLVELGPAFADRVLVTQGLAEGDRIVTTGTFLVDSESRMHSGSFVTAAAHKDDEKAAKLQDLGVTIDPVCGMPIDHDAALASGHVENYRGTSYLFCSDTCQRKFHKDPAKYGGDSVKTALDKRLGPGHSND
jgi:membrane fusion protein, copper/silver efflux system